MLGSLEMLSGGRVNCMLICQPCPCLCWECLLLLLQLKQHEELQGETCSVCVSLLWIERSAFLSRSHRMGPPAPGLILLSSFLHRFSIITLKESCERSGFLQHQGDSLLLFSQLAPSDSSLDLVEVASLDCAYTKSQVPGGLASWCAGNLHSRHCAHFWLHTCWMDFNKLKKLKRMTRPYRFWLIVKAGRNIYFGWTAKCMGERGISLCVREI